MLRFNWKSTTKDLHCFHKYQVPIVTSMERLDWTHDTIMVVAVILTKQANEDLPNCSVVGCLDIIS